MFDESVLKTLIEEYKLVNQRIELQNTLYQKTMIQECIIYGAIMAFIISSYFDLNLYTIINASVFLGLSIISLAVILHSATFGIKNFSYGEYLYVLEMRIFHAQKLAGFSGSKCIDWETWRLQNGIANDPVIGHDALYGILIFIIPTPFMWGLRLTYIYSFFYSDFRLWLIVCSFVIVFACFTLLVVGRRFFIWRKREKYKLKTHQTQLDPELYGVKIKTVDVTLKNTRVLLKKIHNGIPSTTITFFQALYILSSIGDKKNTKIKNNCCTYIVAYFFDKVVGMVLVGTNNQYNKIHKANQGFFALFHCVNSVKIASGIFEFAKQWMEVHGIADLVGPESVTFDDFSKGLLVGGFQKKNYVLNPHTPEYYHELLVAVGFDKKRDHFCFDFSIDAILSQKSLTYSSNFCKCRIISPNLFGRKFAICQNDIYNLLQNEIPKELDQLINPTKEDLAGVLKTLRLVATKNFIKIAYNNENTPVGIIIALPNYNSINTANVPTFLIPFHILLRLHSIKSARVLFAFIAPSSQHRGVAISLANELLTELRNQGFNEVEISTIDEMNDLCLKTVRHFCHNKKSTPDKTYREYILHYQEN